MVSWPHNSMMEVFVCMIKKLSSGINNKKASGINFYSIAIILIILGAFAVATQYFVITQRAKYVEEKTQLIADSVVTDYSRDMFNSIKQGKSTAVVTDEEKGEIDAEIKRRFTSSFEENINWNVTGDPSSGGKIVHVDGDNREDYWISNFSVSIKSLPDQEIQLWVYVDFDLTLPYTVFGEMTVPIRIESVLKDKVSNLSPTGP